MIWTQQPGGSEICLQIITAADHLHIPGQTEGGAGGFYSRATLTLTAVSVLVKVQF